MRDAPGAPRAAFLDFVHADDVTAMIAARAQVAETIFGSKLPQRAQRRRDQTSAP